MGIKEAMKNNIYLYKLGIKYTPGFFIIIIIQNILNAILNLLTTIWFTKKLFESMSGGEIFSNILYIIIQMAIAYIFIGLVNTYIKNCYTPKIKMILHEKMQSDFFKKARNMDIECYDSTTFYNDFIWTMDDADSRVLGAMNNIGSIIFQMIFCSSIIKMLLSYDSIIAIVIVITIGISTLINIWRIKVCVKRDFELKKANRKIDYFSRVFYLKEYSKEIRTSDVGDILIDEFNENYEKVNKLTYEYGKKTMLINFLMRLSTTSFFDVGIVLIVAYKLIQKDIDVSVFAVMINIVWQLFFKFNWFINCVTKFYEDGVYCKKIRTFIERKSNIHEKKDGQEVEPLQGTIQVKNLNFGYGESKVLKNLNMEINKGEKIAIVGYNGSGKSTFIKLLMRLYDPCNGEILVNDKNIKEYKLDSYRKSFGTIFQDFKLFAIKVAENVAMDLKYDEKEVEESLIKSGFDLYEKNIRVENEVTKEFNNEGLVFSGGEQQKVAIARSFYKDCSIIVMDEPSSALDPMVEYEINKQIFGNMKENTIIFVSHRLSTACLADKIFMFDNGEIIETGTHKELIDLGGKYAKMYDIQAKKYRYTH